MKKLFLLLLGIASIPAAFSQGGSGIDWAADLDYLASELPAKHCNLFAKYDKARFETAIGAIKASAGEAGDFATALKTQQLIAKLGDSHTMLYFQQLINRQQILPIGLLWGLRRVVRHTDDRRKQRVAGAPAHSGRQGTGRNRNRQPEHPFHGRQRGYGEIHDPPIVPVVAAPGIFRVRTQRAGGTHAGRGQDLYAQTVRSAAGRSAAFQPDSLPFAIAERNVLFTDRYFPEEKIYYILYNSCWGRESEAEFKSREKAASLPSFTEFGQKAFGILQGNPVGKIIFDMRNNGGGNSAQGTAFIERLAGFLKQHPGIKPMSSSGEAHSPRPS